ncbi:putative bifunctional diguanylate cyclase/phosphodiesterase [Methylophaga sp. OBS3]|uniref:putative bifunctional diguanylate cyclase/phosphodiesterase n=1 Tax=Methylophaga sp. OBS3 TaxID=2991934 RepID=UPI0022593D18|nr:bifunctional diguanylate cyclase/phosphodiesterase [Methylophaga sp. OBS3]MCX4188742.1 EAL domain-containing protein [Methylophaga sp. OBS3]
MGRLVDDLVTWFKSYRKNGHFAPLKIALAYAVFSGLWIIFSDRVIEFLADDINVLSQLQTFKGLFFVTLTSLMIWFLVHRSFRAKNRLVTALSQSQQRQQILLNTIPYGIQESDLDGKITYSNKAHHDILAADAGTLLDKYIWDFNSEAHGKHQHKQRYAEKVEKQITPEPYITTHTAMDGQQKVLEIVWDYLRDADDKLKGIISVVSDITLRKRQEERILQLAHYDNLTKLPNRFLSLDRLNQVLVQAKQHETIAAVVFIDLDNFKKINDTLGHEAGDNILVQAANRLRIQQRKGDTVGRLGGDEFIAILSEVPSQNALLTVTENLLEQFRRPFIVAGRELMLTASIGLALYPQDGSDASTLLRHADSAMFDAKERGRNNFSFFTPEMNLAAARRLSIEQQMHGALERDEFYLNYQPLHRLGDNKLIGVEALLRWHNPILGQVAPDEFIPIAEQTGHIIKIGEYVLKTAMKAVSQWQQLIPKMHVAINLSPAQLRDDYLIDFIRDCLNRHPLHTGTLQLEITEGVLLSGFANTDSILQTLTEMHIQLAMDDFGTGYSSLMYLRHYPFDILKIDRSFIADIIDDVGDRELVNAMIAMAHGLGLRVVAEGVENDEQRSMLKNLGCDYGQGYFFSKPVAVTEMAEKVRLQANS